MRQSSALVVPAFALLVLSAAVVVQSAPRAPETAAAPTSDGCEATYSGEVAAEFVGADYCVLIVPESKVATYPDRAAFSVIVYNHGDSGEIAGTVLASTDTEFVVTGPGTPPVTADEDDFSAVRAEQRFAVGPVESPEKVEVRFEKEGSTEEMGTGVILLGITDGNGQYFHWERVHYSIVGDPPTPPPPTSCTNRGAWLPPRNWEPHCLLYYRLFQLLTVYVVVISSIGLVTFLDRHYGVDGALGTLAIEPEEIDGEGTIPERFRAGLWLVGVVVVVGTLEFLYRFYDGRRAE